MFHIFIIHINKPANIIAINMLSLLDLFILSSCDFSPVLSLRLSFFFFSLVYCFLNVHPVTLASMGLQAILFLLESDMETVKDNYLCIDFLCWHCTDNCQQILESTFWLIIFLACTIMKKQGTKG
ncbi:hypothetical protein SAY87_001057 [Trapa incisa]|uniref:Uncharacterized protein n=1 Tax=Trapa incisa TaxID=236973 RepID=A0AAN7GG90_9MYRT|nr:hypothetical protein SAY87_001057 [Trapa incisa]